MKRFWVALDYTEDETQYSVEQLVEALRSSLKRGCAGTVWKIGVITCDDDEVKALVSDSQYRETRNNIIANNGGWVTALGIYRFPSESQCLAAWVSLNNAFPNQGITTHFDRLFIPKEIP